MRVLNQLYHDLDFASGDLMPVTHRPCRKRSDWLEKGEWLAAGKRAGADRLFFVHNSPVAVFANCGGTELEKIRAFNRAWCLARPRLLFLATPGELTVYDLNQPPVDESDKSRWKTLKHLEVLRDINEIATRLQSFHRDNLESGNLFEDKRFGSLKDRADKALIRDLKTVRRELIEADLSDEKTRFAHALIGRSIFIRYLEDRGVLTEEYFLNIAGKTAGWTALLKSPASRPGIDFTENKSFYARILSNKDFTYATFRKLARDFNGDMFTDVEDEADVVTGKHLSLLQDLMFGDVGSQKKLFFYSYQFNIVPLDLISSIYEEFYHSSTKVNDNKSKARQDGAYYTPAALAEFVLARVLTSCVLKSRPRVLDPACGSGIFLVEAFRRIVRHKWHQKKSPLTFNELKIILKDRIAGIEANPEAARITAFSLYLSMLHYLDPPAIVRQIKLGNTLPNLVASSSSSSNHLHCIFPGNAFDTEAIESKAIWRDRFGSNCADVIVGNPPWGAPGRSSDTITVERHRIMMDWCARNTNPISDKEPSQAFLWRAIDLLRPQGKAAMLLPAGVLFKHGPTAQVFRQVWLDQVQLDEVFNFSQVRKVFFHGATAPFLMISFRNAPQHEEPVTHWTARQTNLARNTQTVVLTKYDRTLLQGQPLSSYSLWKTLYIGRLGDWDLLKRLGLNPPLSSIVDRNSSGQGFKVAGREKAADELKTFPRLEIDSFSRHGDLRFGLAPPHVHRLGVLSAYSGPRLLVQRGIEEKSSDKGTIVSRYEAKNFCFTNAVNGIKLISSQRDSYKTILGILWSSLARYFFLLKSSNWGLWHHELHLDDEILQLPIVLDKNNPATAQIITNVNDLRSYRPKLRSLLNPRGETQEGIASQRRLWGRQLDEAVFKLYGLSEEHQDLIRDCCEVTLPSFYKPFDSIGSTPVVNDGETSWIERYTHIFSRRWQPYLENEEEMRAEVHIGSHGHMLAMEFYPADANDAWDLAPKDDWGYVLDQLSNTLPTSMGTSQIVLDGVVHVVSDRGIIIIKRNEKRLWTRSLAREDADSTLAKQMTQTMPQQEYTG